MKAKRNRIAGFLVLGLSAGLALSPALEAARLQLDSDMQAREENEGQMSRIGFLRSGSIVEIPDEYLVMSHGTPDVELSLNRWLREAGHLDGATPGAYSLSDGRVDYFFPVKVIQAAPGSEWHGQGTAFLALSYLARNEKLSFVTEDAPVYRASAAKSTIGHCKPEQPQAPLDRLLADLSGVFKRVDSTEKNNLQRTAYDRSRLEHTFAKSCGVAMTGPGGFQEWMRGRAEASSIPPELLFSLMLQESGGDCREIRSEHNGLKSVGPFQVNTGSTKFRPCTPEQQSELKKLSLPKMESDKRVRCLGNPAVNLKEAIRILKEKEEALLSLKSDSGAFDLKRVSADDRWRLVIAAYNGGQKWVGQAIADLERFNQLHGTRLDPNRWEDLRLFFFRQSLSRKKRLAHLGVSSSGRSSRLATINVAYVESILGRSESRTKPLSESL